MPILPIKKYRATRSKWMFIPVLFILLLMANGSMAGGLSFNGEIRERFESLNGMNKKAYGDKSVDASGKVRGDSHDNLLLQRLIAGLTYVPSKRIVCQLHLYDARVWGWSLDQDDFVQNRNTPDEHVMNPNEEYLELYDANVKIKDIFIKGLSLQLGRQKIWYGDKRIFGPGGWGNTIGWLWDAGRISFRKNNNFLDAWYGQTKTKDDHSFSLMHRHAYQGIGIYSHYQLMTNSALEPFFSWKNNLFHHLSPEEKSIYYGTRFYEKDFHGFNWDFTYARECGDIGGKKIRAFGYVAKVGYRFKQVPTSPNLVFGRVFASGDNNPGDNTVKTYTRPFGSTDGEHYGRMDIMSWGNLVDNQVSLDLEPNVKLWLKLTCHYFSLDEAKDAWNYYKYKNKPGNSFTHLGDELDFQCRYNISKSLSLQIIYAYFHAGSFIVHNIDDNDAHRFFLQGTYKFDISSRKGVSIFH